LKNYFAKRNRTLFLVTNEKKMKKILVLGHKGMLGQVVASYYKKKHFDVITTDLRFDKDNFEQWSEFVKNQGDCVIINCIGKIKQKTDDTFDLIWANSILPLQLANIMSSNQFLIHPSTDCVFEGNKNEPYTLSDASDAKDIYGWSKRLGEVALKNNQKAIVVRVSIIGPDSSPQPKGLLGWFLSQPEGSELRGFTNHTWNGITTLEWCIQVEKMLDNISAFGGKLIQLGTIQYYSKYEMLLLFQEVYKTSHKIVAHKTDNPIFRHLKPTIVSENLQSLLLNLSNYKT
jgi:dTDP-4-dehydrorhamnose reductase